MSLVILYLECLCVTAITMILLLLFLKFTSIIYSLSKEDIKFIKKNKKSDEIYAEKPRFLQNEDCPSPICSVYLEDHLSMISDEETIKEEMKKKYNYWAFDTFVEGVQITEPSNSIHHEEYVKRLENQLNILNNDFERALSRDSENHQRIHSYNFHNQYLLPLDTPARRHSDSEIFDANRLEQGE